MVLTRGNFYDGLPLQVGNGLRGRLVPVIPDPQLPVKVFPPGKDLAVHCHGKDVPIPYGHRFDLSSNRNFDGVGCARRKVTPAELTGFVGTPHVKLACLSDRGSRKLPTNDRGEV